MLKKLVALKVLPTERSFVLRVEDTLPAVRFVVLTLSEYVRVMVRLVVLTRPAEIEDIK
jgi:hypothetical protein